MSNDQAVFSFELNESLYFQKGEEIDEIRGISLDPEIAIQPFNDYISIRGVIKLRGEYLKGDAEGEKQDEILENTDDYHAKRFVEEVVDTEDGETEFSHRFPVEISVPSDRVVNLDEVMVSIDSFDYELSENRQLTFASTIAIHGVTEQDETTEENTANTLIHDTDQTFHFDIKEPQQESEEKTPEAPASTEYQDIPALTNETEPSEEMSSSDRWKHKKSQSLSEFLQKEPVAKSEAETQPEHVETISSEDGNTYAEQGEDDSMEYTYSMEPVDTDNTQESSSSSSSDHDWESPSSSSNEMLMEGTEEITTNEYPAASPQINETAETDTNETADASYLSDMFRDEEESFSRMRVCIVQEQDTLEMIASRYNISTIHLIKKNHLEDDSVSEGQLLYIPEKKY